MSASRPARRATTAVAALALASSALVAGAAPASAASNCTGWSPVSGTGGNVDFRVCVSTAAASGGKAKLVASSQLRTNVFAKGRKASVKTSVRRNSGTYYSVLREVSTIGAVKTVGTGTVSRVLARSGSAEGKVFGTVQVSIRGGAWKTVKYGGKVIVAYKH